MEQPTPGRRDGASPNANAPPEGPFPWVGPKTVVLRKSSQGGFGFTLRHFIVYPPESAVHSTTKEEENGNRAGPPRSRLEPMDTIFVKNVREDGPAHQAGLHTGDRLVKVNGESIIGKTYSQVIALIQNSDDVLELSIMPKDEDILQLAYSQDAYLKGNEPYSGGAQSIPEPPPICYPRKTYPFQSRGAEPPPGQMPDTRAPRPAAAGPSSPLGTATLASTRGEAGGSPAHRPDEPQPGGPPPRPTAPHGHPGSFSRTGCPSNVASSLPDRYGVSPATSSCYGVPKHLPEHRTHCGFKEGVGGLSGAGRPPREASGSQRAPGRQECQQALSRWFCSQEPRRSASEERRHAMPPRYRSVSQDRLGGGSSAAPRGWPHSASHDTLVQPPRESWAPRARSDHYLGRYGRSMEALEPSALLSPRLDRSAWPPERLCRATVTAAGQPVPHSSFAPSSSSSSSSSREPAPVQKHPSQPNLQSADDSGYIGYRSYSPSFQRRTGLLHALSFRDPAFGGLPTFSISQRPAGPLPERVVTAIPPPTGPQPIPAAPREQRPESSRVPEQPEERREEVVLRQKPPTGRKMPPPMRQMNFVFPEGVKETDICDPPPASGKGERLVAERQGRRVAPLAAPEDSLASIPFIDEPTSPSIDLKAKHVPASSVVSSAMNSAPAVATSPSSPTFAFALSRHYSQDCSSIKAGRRSSYLLAITTERSKSCDDGLNAFRDEGKILRRMPSRVPSLRMLRSFFTDGSLDSLGTSEDARSKRHSTSDLSDVPFSAVRKEGWLHCKQILTKKGKKVGGGIRQWKRVFAVLRTHSLYLCKDRREAVTCAPAPGRGSGRHAGLDQSHQGEQQGRGRGESHMGLPAASGSPGTNRLGSLRLFALCCFPRPRPAPAWPAGVGLAGPVPCSQERTGARGHRGVQEERGRVRGSLGGMALRALPGRVGTGCAGSAFGRATGEECAWLCRGVLCLLRRRERPGRELLGTVPARRCRGWCRVGAEPWSVRWVARVGNGESCSPGAAGSGGGSAGLDVPALGWLRAVSPRCLSWSQRFCQACGGLRPWRVRWARSGLWFSVAQPRSAGRRGLGRAGGTGTGKVLPGRSARSRLGTIRGCGAAGRAASRRDGCVSLDAAWCSGCAWRGQTEVCVLPRDIAVPEPLRPVRTPHAAPCCGKERRRPQRGGERRLFRGCGGPVLPSPAPAWPRAVPGRAWTCLGPPADALLKLSLPLFSLPPQDPGFASQALINKKLNDYRKVSPAGAKPDSSPKGSRGLGIRAEFLKQTGTSAPRSPRQDAAVTKDESSSQKAPWGINLMKKNKKSVPRAFGVRLEDCQPAPDNKNVPLIVEACCKVVEDRGLEYMGIYRVPGNNAVVSSLQEQLNKGATEINLQDERWQDLNVISSLLKSFFRKLPEPLFTDDKYNDFIEANRIEDASERMRTLRKLIRDLPGHYYETLKFLVGHLKTIADHSEKNKMEPRNLALVFGPTLVRTSEDNMTDMVTHMPDRYKIVETLIQHSDWFFSDKEDKGEKTPVDEKEAQSVPNIEYLLPNIGRTAAPGDAAGSTRSGSAKPKGTWPSRKAPPHRELLAIPFVSAAARKRKKKREAEGVGSSTDDDAERRDTPGREQEDEGTAATLPAPGKAPRGTGGEPAVPSPAGMERESSLEPGGAGSDPAPDARSIVSGYSTLSTMDRSLCSEVQSVAGSRGEEADDERSELSHMETDTESREGARPRMGQVAGGTGDEDKGLPGRPSFNSHRLIQCDTLARRKLGRPRPAGETPAPGGEEQGWVPPGRPSLREQLRQRLRVSADDMGVRLRRAHSPETRRKKSSWRRHTVVVPGGLKDLNFNEWKEPRGLEVAPGPCRDKDSGLSSLESTKARPAATAAAQPGTAGERPATKSPPSSPGPPAPLRFPQCL
ncbi:rho GTPase-activating protein 23 isoform X3 [Chroicocephalus ridibundus]|uniref:rho GTPase-activating protein 23 isoform X3 n=1 Tax=Chroicocephalus ridibundus TaxID=1192867 RepID=UPI002FDCF955